MTTSNAIPHRALSRGINIITEYSMMKARYRLGLASIDDLLELVDSYVYAEKPEEVAIIKEE